MNKLWVGIILFSLTYGLITGRYEELATTILAIPSNGLD